MNIIFCILLLIHTLWIVGFQGLGPLWIPRKYLFVYTIACALVGFHWVLFDNKCILSILENKLLPGDQKDKKDDSHFYRITKEKTGVDENTQRRIQHTIMTFNFLLVGYIYRKDWRMILITLYCLYAYRWSKWSTL